MSGGLEVGGLFVTGDAAQQARLFPLAQGEDDEQGRSGEDAGSKERELFGEDRKEPQRGYEDGGGERLPQHLCPCARAGQDSCHLPWEEGCQQQRRCHPRSHEGEHQEEDGGLLHDRDAERAAKHGRGARGCKPSQQHTCCALAAPFLSARDVFGPVVFCLFVVGGKGEGGDAPSVAGEQQQECCERAAKDGPVELESPAELFSAAFCQHQHASEYQEGEHHAERVGEQGSL